MGIKKHIIATVLVALPLVAGCQQRTEFDACVEYYEQKVRDKSKEMVTDLRKVKLADFDRLSPLMLWDQCSAKGV